MFTQPSLRPGRRGTAAPAFTLIEILCVVVIIGIAAAIVVPSIGSRDDLRAASMARVVMADLIYAQNRAVSLQKVQYVRFNTATQLYEVLDSIGPDVLVTHPVEQKPFQVKLSNGRTDDLRFVKLDTVSFDGKAVMAFDELGTPLSVDTGTGTKSPMVSGNIVLDSGGYKLTISVEPYSGELKVN
jgi:prepilin-type N-terminal cleavage/methylation domain-containing protein